MLAVGVSMATRFDEKHTKSIRKHEKAYVKHEASNLERMLVGVSGHQVRWGHSWRGIFSCGARLLLAWQTLGDFYEYEKRTHSQLFLSIGFLKFKDFVDLIIKRFPCSAVQHFAFILSDSIFWRPFGSAVYISPRQHIKLWLALQFADISKQFYLEVWDFSVKELYYSWQSSFL